MLSIGERPKARDFPPELKWEQPLWLLAMRLHSQVRTNAMGAIIGYDLNVFVPLIQDKGWHLGIAMELLMTISHGMHGPQDDDEQEET